MLVGRTLRVRSHLSHSLCSGGVRFSSSVVKSNPDEYYNWIGSNYSLKGVAESISHPNNLSITTPNHFELALYRMQKYGEWERIAPILDFVEKEAPFKPTEKMYGYQLMALAKKEQHEKVVERFQALKEKNDSEIISVHSWNIYLLGLANNQQLDTLLSEFESFKEAGFKPDEYSYHALIQGYMITKKYDEALGVLDLMRENGIEPTPRTYTIIVNWYAKKNQPSLALGVIKKMRRDGVQPDTVTYTSLIHGMSINKKSLEGFEWLKKMYSMGIQPNLKTYTTLVKGFDLSKQYGYVIRLSKMLDNDDNIEVPTKTRRTIDKIIQKAGVSLTNTGKQ